MTDKSIIIIAHMPSDNTRALAEAVLEGTRSPDIHGVTARLISPFDAHAEDVLHADAVVLGTTENLGYMSGALKDFFDRTYYDCLDKTDAKPMASFIRAGLDGTGTKRAILSITGGLRWRVIQDPLVCKGEFQPQFVTDCHDLGMAVAAGLETGVF